MRSSSLRLLALLALLLGPYGLTAGLHALSHLAEDDGGGHAADDHGADHAPVCPVGDSSDNADPAACLTCQLLGHTAGELSPPPQPLLAHEWTELAVAPEETPAARPPRLPFGARAPPSSV